MHRLLGVVFLCSSVLLIAAAPSLPVATPTPLPLLTAAPAATGGLINPTVIVYPFDVQGGVDPKIGIAMAQITSQQMIASGGLTVDAVPSGVPRANFLDNARTQKADYYVSGYVTPVGEIAAVVVQLVAVDSGIIIYSQTAQVQTVGDIDSQALTERDAILAYAHPQARGSVAEGKGTPEPTSTNGSSIKVGGLSNIVDSVFGKHAKATPTPAVTATKPPRGVIVARVTGPPELSGDLTNATNALYTALNHYYNAKMTGVVQPVAQSADAICGTDRNNTIATGSLAQTSTGGHHPKMKVGFTLQVYACFGAPLAQETATGDNVSQAVAAAVAAYAKDHPDNS